MSYKVFFDTNILAYAFDQGSPKKNEQAKELISRWMPIGRMVISTQVLQELFVVLTKKLEPRLSADNAGEVIESLLSLEVKVVETDTILKAINVSKENTISFWDALIISSAIDSKCRVLFTEDLNRGQTIAGVKIENPFEES
ncbi:MAG: PIN domain-containing protein [Syntrophales bacterium]|nr:PIN domain-containing protein [Syntrophales bacterium]